jgi:hypothetical protein
MTFRRDRDPLEREIHVLANADTGELATVTHTGWFVPTTLTRDGDDIVWWPSFKSDDEQQHGTHRAVQAPSGRKLRETSTTSSPDRRSTAQELSGRKWLEAFCRLAEAKDEAVVRFAREWGPLYLCRDHRIPSGWERGDPEAPWQERHGPMCAPWRLGMEYREPIAGWRHYAGEARSIVTLAAYVRNAPEGKSAKDLEPFPDAAWRVVSLGWPRPKARAEDRRTGLAEVRLVLAGAVNWWLTQGHIRLALTWSEADGGMAPVVEVDSVFGALATQLFAAVGGSASIAVCRGCGWPYFRDRQPPRTRRNYCSPCHDSGIPLRDAQRAHRSGQSNSRRQREDDRLPHQHLSAAET